MNIVGTRRSRPEGVNRPKRRNLGALFSILVIGGVRADPLRALVALGALAFATALAVSTVLAGVATTSGLSGSGDELDSHVDLEIVGSGRGIDEQLFPRVRDVDGVADARAIAAGDAIFGSETIRVIGIDLLQPIPGTSGSGLVLAGPFAPHGGNLDPSNALFGGAIVSNRMAQQHNLRIGTRFAVYSDGRREGLHVAYVLPPNVAGVDSETMFVDLATAQDLFNSYGFVERIDCVVARNVDKTSERITAILPPGTFVQAPRNDIVGFARLISGLRDSLDWLAASTFIVAGLFTYNAVSASVAQRRGFIAIVRGLGASRSSVFQTFLCEGALYGLLGSSVGASLGVAGAQQMIAVLVPGATHAALSAFSYVEIQTIVLVIAIGSLFAILSAAQPAAIAMRVPPASALGLERVDVLPPRWYRLVAQRSVNGIVRLFGMRAPALYLAVHGLFATPIRILFVLIALSFAIANAVSYTITSSSYAQATHAWMDQTMGGDIVVTAHGFGQATPVALPSSTLKRLRIIEGVAEAIPARTFLVSSAGRGRFALRGDDGAAPPESTLRSSLNEASASVSAPLAHRLALNIGDRLSIVTPTGPRILRITSVPDDFANSNGIATVRFSQTAAWFNDDRPDTIVVQAQSGISIVAVRTRIVNALATLAVDVRTTREIRHGVQELFELSFSIARVLSGMALLIVIVGICALLATLVLERRTQFAMLRFVGASSGFVQSVVLYQAAFLALTAFVIGTITGFAGAITTLWISGSSEFDHAIPLDESCITIFLMLTLTFVACILAAIPAARSAGRISADVRTP